MAVRQIVLDTETTGLNPLEGHKIIEIGCIELIDRRQTGNTFHKYLNPERAVDEGALKVHGLSNEFLSDKLKFSDILDDFIAFIKGAELIIHNAPFDIGFLNAELKAAGQTYEIKTICSVIDTLVLAKKMHPGQKNNLDALCKRYFVNNSNRSFHGALLDAELLAMVYCEMTGGQIDLFDVERQAEETANAHIQHQKRQPALATPILMASDIELKAHAAFMSEILPK